MLARLVSNSWPQAVCLLRPPKVLGLQECIFFKFLTFMERFEQQRSVKHLTSSKKGSMLRHVL